MEFKISLARVTGSDHSLHSIPVRTKQRYSPVMITPRLHLQTAPEAVRTATSVQSWQPLRLQAS